MKYIIKFEQGSLEQSYKLAEIDLINGIDSVFEILDEEFINKVASRFNDMRTDFIETYKKHN
ncbi:hypothetical protein [Pseudopedobacter beijingensis]|uniref:Phage protein n=1 Tax=Pseudopedobacter beijingensis TaxID=1207056 RepID=A0ABW4IIM4_9SPHI